MNTLRRVVASLLILALVVGAIFVLRDCFTEDNSENKKTLSLWYDVGALSRVTGKKVEDSDNAIHTKDMFKCRGLHVTPDFAGDVTYTVFFYDCDGNFLSHTELLDREFDDVPLLATYARIEITPNEDDSVSWFEKFGYSMQLKVEVSTLQKNVGEDVLEFPTGSYALLWWTSNDVTLDGYEYVVLRVRTPSKVQFYVEDENGTTLVNLNIECTTSLDVIVDDVTYVDSIPNYTREQAGIYEYFKFRITPEMALAYVKVNLLNSNANLYLI